MAVIVRTAMIDDDGSGEVGTVLNNAWKQEFYGQIDAAIGTSVVEIPCRKLVSDRLPASPAPRPSKIPMMTSRMPSRTTSRKTCSVSAPSATRMPISRVRREIVNDSTP